MVKAQDVLLLGAAFLLLRGRQAPAGGTGIRTQILQPREQQGFDFVLAGDRIEDGFKPVPVQTDSGLIIGGLGGSESAPTTSRTAPQVLDPVTGQVIASDPLGAIQTGGGIVADPSGNLRFASGGFVRTDVRGNIIPASFESPERIRELRGLQGEQRSFNELVEPQLALPSEAPGVSVAPLAAREPSGAPIQQEQVQPTDPVVQAAIQASVPSVFKPVISSFQFLRGFLR